MNFYQIVFPEKTFLENIYKKVGFGVINLIFTLFDQSYDFFLNLDYICHKPVEFAKKSETLKFLVIFLLEKW